MKIKLFFVLILALAIAGGVHIVRTQTEIPELPEAGETTIVIDEIVARAPSNLPKTEAAREIIAPPPLRVEQGRVGEFLTVAGIIQWTNAHRQQNGLPPLLFNAELGAAAAIKTADMFARQYFEHVSPSGEGPGDLAEQVGYEYGAIGENLALGNFENDQDVVQAWMNSAGHRANILHERYKEIGVAVQKGAFEGKEAWIAVQEFGLSLSACPNIDEILKAQFDANQEELSRLEQEITLKREELERTPRRRVGQYNEKVQEYNALVSQYNALLEETKTLANAYNTQVQAFNACIGG